jgi:hypothetical protein
MPMTSIIILVAFEVVPSLNSLDQHPRLFQMEEGAQVIDWSAPGGHGSGLILGF